MKDEILCTLDFSESSRDALAVAVQMAKERNALLTVLFAYRLRKPNGDALAMIREVEEKVLERFAELEKELLLNAGVRYELKTEIGFVEDRVEQHTRLNKIMFLVIGKSMSINTATKESFDSLLAHLQIPLVIVP
jgi:nucleotide-binding universal stress UspA family protein